MDWVKVTAIVCLTVICVTALLKGIDSAVVGAVSGVIGGIVGYEVGKARTKEQE
ncbi:MAG: hypothetical protein QXQ20_08660 [Candidatus Nezhaarchaeales archaeon]